MANTKNASSPKSADLTKDTPVPAQPKKATTGSKPKSAATKSASAKASPAKKSASNLETQPASPTITETPTIAGVEDTPPEKQISVQEPPPDQVEINQLIQAEIDQMIAEAAYYLAEKRNFEPGHEKEDWATASAEVLAKLRRGKAL